MSSTAGEQRAWRMEEEGEEESRQVWMGEAVEDWSPVRGD